jgi:hypothetical protein
MMSSQNVWIDGSLRDGPWFASVFRDINRRFPNYKIAIFEIGAREENVRARIASRAAATGRSVPEALIQASLASVASSLEILTPLCDFVARIGNDGPLPELRAYIRVDNTGNWGLLESQFAKVHLSRLYWHPVLFPLAHLTLDVTQAHVVSFCVLS